MRALALGDLDGDGRAELVVADEQNVTTLPDAGGRGALGGRGRDLPHGAAWCCRSTRRRSRIPAGRSSSWWISAGEGRQGIRARVLEWSPSGGYRVLYDTTGRYLRVVRVGAENWLLEQDVGEDEPFEPEIRRLVWDGERFRETARLRVPRGVSIYGLALMRLTGNPEPEVVAFADDYRLTVWTARGQRLWTSSDPLGGSAVTFEYIPPGGARRQAGGDTIVARIAGRVVPLAMAAPGQEILVYENILPALQQGRGVLPRLAATLFNRGRIHRLRWKDGAFVRVWQSERDGGVHRRLRVRGSRRGRAGGGGRGGRPPGIRPRDPQPARTPQGSYPRLRAPLGAGGFSARPGGTPGGNPYRNRGLTRLFGRC